jgi:hypothetical protein
MDTKWIPVQSFIMVWSIIKAVYGFVVPLPKKEDPYDGAPFDEDFPELKGLRIDYSPEAVSRLDYFRPNKDGMVIVRPPGGLLGGGIAVGKRDKDAGKCMNFWPAYETKDEKFDYSIPEFIPYKSRKGFVFYDLDHSFRCCSKSNHKFVVIGLVYDELERNIFMDSRFEKISEKVLDEPTTIDEIDDELFRHDKEGFITPEGRLTWGQYRTPIQSDPGVRKSQLAEVEKSKKDFVDSLAEKYPFLKRVGPAKRYLMLDDCMSCT